MTDETTDRVIAGAYGVALDMALIIDSLMAAVATRGTEEQWQYLKAATQQALQTAEAALDPDGGILTEHGREAMSQEDRERFMELSMFIRSNMVRTHLPHDHKVWHTEDIDWTAVEGGGVQ